MKKINCILLIDDNPEENVYHKIIINSADITNNIKVANNGFEALSYLNKSGDPAQSELYPKPDVIFLDINMPGMNGFEFLEEYKKLDKKVKSKIVVIMLSTSLNPEDRERAMATNEVAEFQNKPLSVEMLQKLEDRYF